MRRMTGFLFGIHLNNRKVKEVLKLLAQSIGGEEDPDSQVESGRCFAIPTDE